MICSACCSRVEAEIGQNKYFHHIRKVFCKRLIQDGQQNLINFWEVERNVLWVGNSWRIGRRALLDCSHGHPLFLWSVWSCAGLFKAGNSTFLMFSSLRNKMPNIRFFPPFFPPACSCQNRLFSYVLCSQSCAPRLSLLKEGRAVVWGLRGLLLLEGIFLLAFFPVCVRYIKCSGIVQILPAKNGCFHSSPFANFRLVKK